jgi:hypothetical protein
MAAGNNGQNLDSRYTFVYPADFAQAAGNCVVTAAARQDGTIQSYSNYGPRTVALAAKSQYDDGYGHIFDLASSGAAATTAARMASIMTVAPYRGGSRAWYARWVVAAARASAQYVQADAGLIGSGLI